MSFRAKIDHAAKEKFSNLILALDLPPSEPHQLLSRSINLLEEVHPYICAVKINRHLVLPLGLSTGIKRIVNLAHDLGLPTIMDCKINDIGNTNRVIAEFYYNVGFDSVIANPFVGWNEGLQPVFELAKRKRRGVILLVYMSHKGALEGYGQEIMNPKTGELTSQYLVFAEKALSWNADGAVVGATFPGKIEEVYAVLKEHVPIYSPGVGAQGGNIEAAIMAGTRYLIVGRAITLAEEPARTAKLLRDIIQRCADK
ncbi:MAG: orotidine 5'-phosphate decarboxylase [Candidatus Bathyarchaeota archaeon]|nr:orotidine 5'-phosphate decarboxylase [Candidatus Bathyarchaeota archaeon]MDH5733097.1 orotidine 5'-phosphate decarboxylase [Candidatus Bathyarchaeota archaeon]